MGELGKIENKPRKQDNNKEKTDELQEWKNYMLNVLKRLSTEEKEEMLKSFYSTPIEGKTTDETLEELVNKTNHYDDKGSLENALPSFEREKIKFMNFIKNLEDSTKIQNMARAVGMDKEKIFNTNLKELKDNIIGTIRELQRLSLLEEIDMKFRKMEEGKI